MQDLTLLTAMVTTPSSAISSIRERPRFWFPLIISILLAAGMIYWYYSAVDFEWLKHQFLDNAPQMQKLSEAQRQQAMNFMSRNTMMWSGVIGSAVFISVAFVLSATYLLVAGNVSGVRYRFKQWFALSCWTTFPSILLNTLIVALMRLSSDTTQLLPDSLRPLSLNELFFHRIIGQPGQSLLASADLLSLWPIALMTLGVKQWSQRSWLFSLIVVLLPYVVIYGIWAAFALK
ncbi:MAG: YIP1 family protein [Steroidobacter sp.]